MTSMERQNYLTALINDNIRVSDKIVYDGWNEPYGMSITFEKTRGSCPNRIHFSNSAASCSVSVWNDNGFWVHLADSEKPFLWRLLFLNCFVSLGGAGGMNESGHH